MCDSIIDDVITDLIRPVGECALVEHMGEERTNSVINSCFDLIVGNVIESELSEIFETVFLYSRLEAPLSDVVQERLLNEVSTELIDSFISGSIVPDLVSRELFGFKLKSRLADDLTSQIAEQVISQQLRQLMQTARREDAQLKMLLADNVRQRLIDDVIESYAYPIVTNIAIAERTTLNYTSDIINLVITDLITKLVTSEIIDVQNVEINLTGSWVGSLADYKYLSADGRRLLLLHKLFSQDIFLKISIASLGTIGFSTKDLKLVNAWWQMANQPKKSKFSIASILGVNESDNEVGKEEVKSSSVRRKSILDEIRDLQASLQKSIDKSDDDDGRSAIAPFGTKSQFDKGLTPHPPTPGKEFPRTPATPLKTPKDYRSHFQKDFPQQDQPSPDIITIGPPTPPETTTIKDPTFIPIVPSLLDLPMPNLIDLPRNNEVVNEISISSKTPCAQKKRKRLEKDDRPLTSHDDIRRCLKPRSNLDITKIRRPTICAPRLAMAPDEDAGIRLVDNYRLDAIIGEGTFGQVFRGQCQLTKATVALKKVRLDREREGFPITAIREVKLLARLDHENIVKLHCVVQAKDLSAFFLVFEYVDNDLTGIIENRILTHIQIKVMTDLNLF